MHRTIGFQASTAHFCRPAGQRRISCWRRAAAATCSIAQDCCSTSTKPLRQPQAILAQRLKAHSGAITAALWLGLETDGKKEMVTASMDKTLALWRLQDTSLPGATRGSTERSAEVLEEVVRLTPGGGPIFSLAADNSALGEAHRQVFCGNHAKSVVAWEPPDRGTIPKVQLNGHTGWVRALATSGRWLFSCGCNHLRQWDMARAVPRHVREVRLFAGDILGLCSGGGRVFACTSRGSIRAWTVDPKKGELKDAASRDRAHSDRVTAVVFHKGFLYSTSYDGCICMWDATTMEVVMLVRKAHDGQRINCVAVGPDGFLYTGGDDKLVRRWELGALQAPAEGALYCHSYPVRALAADAGSMLLSGDSSGEVAVWQL